MIIIQGGDEAAIAALLEKSLRDMPDVFVLQSEDEISVEMVLSVMAHNLTKIRQYIGRLERNTNKTSEGLRDLGRVVEPIATLAAVQLEETGLSTGELAQIRRSQEERALKAKVEALKNPKGIGGPRQA